MFKLSCRLIFSMHLSYRPINQAFSDCCSPVRSGKFLNLWCVFWVESNLHVHRDLFRSIHRYVEWDQRPIQMWKRRRFLLWLVVYGNRMDGKLQREAKQMRKIAINAMPSITCAINSSYLQNYRYGAFRWNWHSNGSDGTWPALSKYPAALWLECGTPHRISHFAELINQ